MSNLPENKFDSLIHTNGGFALKGSSPDFAVFGKLGSPDENRLKAIVEVKPNAGRKDPRSGQLKILAGLAAYGIPVFVWRPSSIVRIQPNGTSVAVSEQDFLSVVQG